jgi:hypothetical protein
LRGPADQVSTLACCTISPFEECEAVRAARDVLEIVVDDPLRNATKESSARRCMRLVEEKSMKSARAHESTMERIRPFRGV